MNDPNDTINKIRSLTFTALVEEAKKQTSVYTDAASGIPGTVDERCEKLFWAWTASNKRLGRLEQIQPSEAILVLAFLRLVVIGTQNEQKV